MPVKLSDIVDGFEFASFGGFGENQAYLCRQSGEIYLYSEFSDMDEPEELPDDIEDAEKYLPIPDKRDLGLGKSLVLDFARQFLPEGFDNVRDIFRRRGAYGKFKNLLERKGALEKWYDFERAATERALREWCDLNSIKLAD
jgi:hypothetical protein